MDSSYCWMEVWNEALWLYETIGPVESPLHPILYNFVMSQFHVRERMHGMQYTYVT